MQESDHDKRRRKVTQQDLAGTRRQGAATWKASCEAGGWVGSDVEKPKNQSLDSVVMGALLLLGIGATFVIGENLNRTQKTQLSSGAIGAAVGLLVGYGVGKWRP